MLIQHRETQLGSKACVTQIAMTGYKGAKSFSHTSAIFANQSPVVSKHFKAFLTRYFFLAPAACAVPFSSHLDMSKPEEAGQSCVGMSPQNGQTDPKGQSPDVLWWD